MMKINKTLYGKCRAARKLLLAIALISTVLGCTVYILTSINSYIPESLAYVVVNSYIPKSLAYVVVNLSSIHQNITLTSEDIYFLNGVAYDFYSIDELNSHSGAGLQWKTFPLPNEQIPANITPWTPHNHLRNSNTSVYITASPETTTGLAFVDHIYITSTPNLTDRQANLEKMFARYQITNFEWRMKWTHDTCYSPEKREEVHRKINLRAMSLHGEIQRRQCAITMEHIDTWHDIVARNSSLSLIFEDDAVFVPNFREKFDRTIYTAIRTGALKIGGLADCVTDKPRLPTNSNEWVTQDPMIVIGSCHQIHDDSFAKNQRDVPPMLFTHKESATRCTHAYLLTACSARALLLQIDARKNIFLPSDLLLNGQVVASPTLQSFWLDPPIVYQGNKIHDLDGIPSFKRKTY